MRGPEASLRGPKPIGRWVGAWACGVGVFAVVALIFGSQAAPDGFQVASAPGAWVRLVGLLLAAAAAGALVPLVAAHDLPGLAASAVGVGLVAVAQIGRSLMTAPTVRPGDYWIYVVAETAAAALALAVAYAASSAIVERVVGVERREVWRRQVRVGGRRSERTPAASIFLAMGAAMIAAFALAYALNGGKPGEGLGAASAAVTALVAALLMHRAAPIRDSLWFALSVPLWTVLLPGIGWIIAEATGDPVLPLTVAMASVGASPFAFCGAGVAGAMVGFWITYRG